MRYDYSDVWTLTPKSGFATSTFHWQHDLVVWQMCYTCLDVVDVSPHLHVATYELLYLVQFKGQIYDYIMIESWSEGVNLRD